MQDSALVKRCGAAHRDVGPVPHGAGVGRRLRRSRRHPDSFPHYYGLKVIVLCVLMARSRTSRSRTRQSLGRRSCPSRLGPTHPRS